MIDKKLNEVRAIEAVEIAKKYDLRETETKFNEFITQNRLFKVHVLMIGGYSAGKSALLNKYIGKSVLIENQGPETDVATELWFSDNEKVIANMLDGTRAELGSVSNIDIDKVKNVEYYLNSENIKTQCDYIIVDTPGFDSGIEKHNKALMQYVDRGTAFILVVDCERGTVSESALNFINEVSNYSGDIAVVINKCDKKIADDVKEVKEHVEDLLYATCGRQFPVVCTSIYDEDVADKLSKVIAVFQPQYLYDKNVTSLLDKMCSELASALELIKDKKTCNTSELDEEIENRENVKKKIVEQIEAQKKRMSTKLHNEIKEKIVNRVNSQLMCNANMLAQAYKGGIECFQERVVEIIRPIMIEEVEKYSSVAYEDLVKHLNYESLNVTNNLDELQDVILNVYEKLKGLNNDGSMFIPTEKSDKTDALSKGINAYHLASSVLAITTEVVAPPIELIIVFLPEIIKVLGMLTGTSEEQQLVDAIQNKIIPQITAKVRAELDNSLSEVESVMIDNIQSNVSEMLDVENEALEMVKKKKTDLTTNYDSFMETIDKDITSLRK